MFRETQWQIRIDTIFEYPTLQKIHSQPSFSAQTKIKKHLKANAQWMVSNLGGGAHGHLGLVLTPEEYALISEIPYIEPRHPGAFTL